MKLIESSDNILLLFKSSRPELFSKFHQIHRTMEPILINLAMQLATLPKKDCHHRFIPLYFVQFFRAAIL